MPRGGRRQGIAGRAYPNRLDLARDSKAVAASSSPYGQQSALAQVAAQSPPAPGPLAAASAFQMPSLPPFGGPTARPDEPATAGLPFGAGPGPEAMRTQAADPEELDVASMRDQAPLIEFLASQPGSSPVTRAWALRLRGSLPPGR